jgi:hypothetical protein
MWHPATDVERRLREAAQRGDRRGYLRVLAEADLYLYLVKHQVDAGGACSWGTTQDREGNRCVAVRTIGERLPRQPKFVACRFSLQSLAEVWPNPSLSLLVNPRTPAEMRLPAGPLGRRSWKAAARRAAAAKAAERGANPEEARPVRLLTKHTGPLEGPFAHALGCGAHLSITNGVLWNDLGDVYDDYEMDVRLLREWWDITTAHDWRVETDALLAAHDSPPEHEFVLRVRRELSRGASKPLPAGEWRRACAGAVAGMDETDEAKAEADAGLQELIGRILRYEARFRADGLLPPDGFVRSVTGWDYGRAVSLARWGLSARLAPPEAAEAAITRAGELCRKRYDSWEDFSAGYVLGRVVRFDSGEFGAWYEEALTAHRILSTDPDSPWRTIPWEL